MFLILFFSVIYFATSIILNKAHTAKDFVFCVLNTQRNQRSVQTLLQNNYYTCMQYILILAFQGHTVLSFKLSLIINFQVSPTEVCGCPLTNDQLEETGELCCVSKRNCVHHYCWEKLRRAQIDGQRVRQVTYEKQLPIFKRCLTPDNISNFSKLKVFVSSRYRVMAWCTFFPAVA